MFNLNGKIEKGIGLGSELGFSTLNIKLDGSNEKYGIYACKIEMNESIYKGVMHFGPKRFGTEDFEKIYCEVHIFDFNQDIDSGQVSIKVLKKIRDVREFKSINELVAQVNKDINIAKQFFKDA